MVFEPDWSGHHFAYVRLVLPALKELADEVVLATARGARESEEYGVLLSAMAGGVTMDDDGAASPGGMLGAARAKAGNLRRAVERHRPDHLYIAYADGISQLVGMSRLAGGAGYLRGVESEAFFFRGGFAYPLGGVRRRVMAEASWWAASLAPWTRVHHIDPMVYNAVQQRGGSLARRMSLLPDPVDPAPAMGREEARRALSIPEAGRYIGIAGQLDDRKGADLLARAFARAELRRDDRLLLVGLHRPALRALLAGELAPLVASGRIVSLDRFVSQEEFLAAIAAMDVVCTPYPLHIGSASIVIRAAAAGRPVLGSTFGWIGWVVERFALGWTCRVGDGAEFALAIRGALDGAAGFAVGEAGRRFVRFHTPENFVASYTRRLRERLGREEGAQNPDWDWVCSAARAGSPGAGMSAVSTQGAGA